MMPILVKTDDVRSARKAKDWHRSQRVILHFTPGLQCAVCSWHFTLTTSKTAVYIVV